MIFLYDAGHLKTQDSFEVNSTPLRTYVRAF